MLGSVCTKLIKNSLHDLAVLTSKQGHHARSQRQACMRYAGGLMTLQCAGTAVHVMLIEVCKLHVSNLIKLSRSVLQRTSLGSGCSVVMVNKA